MTKFLHIKNWKKFQHYNHRCPPWVKLHFEMFTSDDWVTLADDSKLAMVACMLIGSRHDGKVPNDPAYIRRVAYLNKPVNLKPLIECGFLSETLADASTMQADASESKQMLATSPPELELDTEKEKKEDIRALAKATRPDVDQDFQKFKSVYPKREGANPWQPARKSFLKSLKAGATVEEIISGAKRFAAAERERVNTPYIPQAVTWLNQQRWKDYADNPPATASPEAPPGMPSNEELIAKYSRKADEAAGTKADSVGESSPVVEGGLRVRETERELVLDEPGIARVRSLGGLLPQAGLGASRVSNANGRQGSHDADAVAGVVHNANPAAIN